jgi:hypothetical protein
MTDPRLRVIQRSQDADEAAILNVLDGRTILVRMPVGQRPRAHLAHGPRPQAQSRLNFRLRRPTHRSLDWGIPTIAGEEFP